MQNRRGFLIKAAAGFAAMGLVVVGSVLADELIGFISKVDIEGKELTVIEKESEKEIKIKINDETETKTKDGYAKLDPERLEKLEKRVKGAVDAGKKGVEAKITHEKGVASKIEAKFTKKKKAE
jgi:hypothetical protein